MMPPSTPYRIRIVSSYIYDKDDLPYATMGRRNRWVHGFVSEITRQGSGLREFDMQFEPRPATREALARLVERYTEEEVGLILIPGTDSAIRVAEVNTRIPMLYFGAHPENNGMELLDHPRISGVRLNLPLIWDYDTFSLLKTLLPELRQIYFPLNVNSEFAFPNVKKNYELHTATTQQFWIPGPSSKIGYRSVQFLAQRLGVDYYEGPYSSIAELKSGLEKVDASNSALIGFNDTVLNSAAVTAILEFSRARRIPLFWVNNASIVKAAGVADFSSDFEAIGHLLAKMSLSILRDRKPISEIPFEDDPGKKLSLNLAECRELGISVAAEVKAHFHEVFA
jgi:ABC-type uncharacterized transport system substrate-binding protein